MAMPDDNRVVIQLPPAASCRRVHGNCGHYDPVPGMGPKRGVCMAHPPTVQLLPGGQSALGQMQLVPIGTYPPVGADDRACGEWFPADLSAINLPEGK